MTSFIDISISPSNQEEPYLILLFENGKVTHVAHYRHIASVAAYCQRQHLPVVSGSAQVCTALAAHDIAVQPFQTRAVGGAG